ncbi:unnamed protein product [Coffea canephora]|uniref:Uncharacterized protein n=2 Tax=Coffea TaxID=13442 RepID=A0A068U3B8_COFCA|nr:uncharacterized protein LOC113698021 [Coffea arabica]CDP02103.1 unnamed protein product [Coffea canephora]
MNDYPTPVPRRDGRRGTLHLDGSRKGAPARPHGRHMTMEDESGDLIKCTGKSCQSCTAGLIADCVAVCCCPCAVVNILVFAFLKVPWMVGRRILKLGKKKQQGQGAGKLERNERQKCVGEMTNYLECTMESDGISRKSRAVEQGASEFVFSGFGDEVLKDNFSARFEAEELWFELHQFGHLGFGRVSFTGIPSLSRTN